MAKKAYIGVDGVARKVKKGYIGVEGLARKIKKAYIGVGGVARPCWSGGTLTYYGQTYYLNSGKRQLAATHIGDFALFGGGSTTGGTTLSEVEVYNSSLQKTKGEALTQARYYLGATHIGDYAIFAGGVNSSNSNGLSTIDLYHKDSLTHSSPISLPNSDWLLSATHNDNYAIFEGGYNSVNSAAISEDLTVQAIASRFNDNMKAGAAHVGQYAVIAGGQTPSGGYRMHTWAYSADLTRIDTMSGLWASRGGIGGTNVGKHVIFAGGQNSTTYSTKVDAYDDTLVKVASGMVQDISKGRTELGATHLEGFAIFYGGTQSSALKSVDVYDDSLTKIEFADLEYAMQRPGATHVGNFALFGGGGVSAVEVFTIV
jgi:hypothetical protein